MERLRLRKLLLLTVLLLPASDAFSDAASENAAGSGTVHGKEIMRELEARDSGWGSATVDLTMTLRMPTGEESHRELEVKLLEVHDDGDKSLTLFKTPRDIRDTAFLSHSHARVPDDQWIYMPTLKRVKRISSANKSGPFMGSELAYEDIASFELAKYTYSYAGEESLSGVPCFVVDLTPLYEYSGYTRIRYWVEKERFIPLRIEYFDRGGSPLKTQTFSGYRQYKGQYWRPEESEIHNVQNDRSTHLAWGEFDFDAELNGNDFTRMSLRRGR